MADISETVIEFKRKVVAKFRSFITGVDEFIDERIKSPFVWSFILSWLVVNWEIPAKIIFEYEVVDVVWLSGQLESIDKFGYIIPLIFSLLYVLILRPAFSFLGSFGRWMMGFSQKFNDYIMRRQPIPHTELARVKRQVRHLKELAGQELIDLEELRKSYDSVQEELTSEKEGRASREEENKRLRLELNNQKESYQELENQFKAYTEYLSDIKKDAFNQLDLFANKISESEMGTYSKFYEKFKKIIDNVDQENSLDSYIIKWSSNNARASEPAYLEKEDGNNNEQDGYVVEKRLLLALNDSEWFNKVDVAEQLSISSNIVEKVLEDIIASGWAKQQGNRYSLTDEGLEKVDSIVSDQDQRVPELNTDYLDEQRRLIRGLLVFTPLSVSEIKGKIKLLGNLQMLLDDMVEKGEIAVSGSVYRLKDT